MINVVISAILVTLARIKAAIAKTKPHGQDKRLVICRGGVGDVIITVRILINSELSGCDLLTTEVSGEWVRQTCDGLFDNVFTSTNDLSSEIRSYGTIHIVRSDVTSLRAMLLRRIYFSDVMYNHHYDGFRFFERLSLIFSAKKKKNYYSRFRVIDLYSTVLGMPRWEMDASIDLTDRNIGKIGIHAGASNVVRAINLEAILDVIAAYPNCTFYILGSEMEMAQFPKERFSSDNVEYLIGELSFRDIALLMNDLDLMVCSDSMFLHYADFMGIPTVAVMGPGPIKMWGPLLAESRIVSRAPPCSPCSLVKCERYNGRSCVGDVGGEEISRAITAIMDGQ